MMTWISNLVIIRGLGGDVLVKGILLTTAISNTITLSAEDIVAFVALMGAIGAIFGVIFAVYRWYLHQQDQDKVIADLKKEQAEEIAEIKKEQQLLTYGMLACLDGLKQLNCDGSVTEARDKLSKHLNTQAHK